MTVSVLGAGILQENKTGFFRPSRALTADLSTMSEDLDQVRTLMFEGLQEVMSGPANGAARYQVATGGSLMRARLALISCKNFGCSRQYALAAAAACELVHNASLVHDDLIDGDSLRRGQPTVWKKHGTGVALCAGDLLLCVAFGMAARLDDARQARLLSHHLSTMASRVIVGQSIEIAPREPGSMPGFREYLDATRAKTVPLIELPLMTGALVANAGDDVRRSIQRLAGTVGLAYQIIDDLDDLPAMGEQALCAVDELHAYHALRHHGAIWSHRLDVSLRRAIRHALASLQRAKTELASLETLVSKDLSAVLAPTITQLERRAQVHQDFLVASMETASVRETAHE